MPLHRPIALALLLGIVAGARLASADDAKAAKDLFDRGAAALTAGKYDVACPALEQSQKLDPHLGTLFALADCEAGWGHGITALARYDEYLALYAALPHDKQARQAEREKAARAAKTHLETTLPTITITLAPGAPAATTVTNDGVAVPASTLGKPMLLDPGEHVFRAEAPGAEPNEQRLWVYKGEKRELALEIKQAPSPRAVAPAPPGGGPSGRRVGAFVTGGIGVAGLLLGAVTGGLMLSKKSAISAGCKATPGGVQRCDQAGASAGDSAKTLGAVASTGFVVGLAGVGAGLALFFTAPKAEPGSSPAVALAPLHLGPDGAVLGARGSF